MIGVVLPQCLAVANHRFLNQPLHTHLLQLLTLLGSWAVLVGVLPECPAAGKAATAVGKAGTVAGQVGTVAGQVGTVAPVADSAVGQSLVGQVVVVHFGSKHLTTVHQLGHWFQQLAGCATLALQGHNLEQEQFAPKLEFPEWL